MKNFLLGLLLTTGLSLAYVQQRVSLILLGYEVEELASMRDDLLDQHRVLHYNVLALQSPVILNERLARQDVRLAPPTDFEIITPRLVAPSAQLGLEIVPPAPGSTGISELFRQSARWLENGRQAVAAPSREER